MRIVVWNCNMGLHSKIDRLMALKPDVAVLPECASPEIFSAKAGLFMPRHYEWITASSDQKGLGVLAFGDYSVTAIERNDPDIRFVLPVEIGGPETFRLLAVWAFNMSDDIPRSDIGPVRRALARYGNWLTTAPSMVAGDFNNHFCFDKPRRECNHANTLAEMETLRMFSAYHHSNGEAAGKETTPTLYWTRNREKPYHIDYCFVSESWKPRLKRVEIGSPDEWLKFSDHMPMIVDIE